MIRGIIILSIFLSSSVFAGELSSVERQKRKIVSRMYQATEGALARCPEQDKNAFKISLDKFKKTYPEFVSVLVRSPYRQYAKNVFSADIQRSKTEPVDKLSKECLYIKSLVDSMLMTESGKEDVNNMLGSLKK